jgi:hypothetical protein
MNISLSKQSNSSSKIYLTSIILYLSTHLESLVLAGLAHVIVNAPCSNNEKLEMTLEKLQHTATAISAPHFKVRWLEFWNSRVHSRQAVHFLP